MLQNVTETDDDMTSGPVTKKDNQRFTSFSKIELDKWPSLIEMSSGEEDAESMEGSENEMDDSGNVTFLIKLIYIPTYVHIY